jgi:lysophospholipase L1-like esterase
MFTLALALALIPDAAAASGVVDDPCREAPSSGPPAAYVQWLVTEGGAPPPPRAANEAQARAAAEDWYLRNDWANQCRYAAANDRLRQSGARPEVVFIGNSVTEYWAVADPQLFAAAYVNRGIAGQTTGQTLGRFMQDVVSLRPKAVHILTGTNDIAGNGGWTSEARIQANITAMVRLARASGIVPILATLTPSRRFGWRPNLDPIVPIARFNGWLRDFARRERIVLIDYHAELADAGQGMPSALSRDGTHPNTAGYQIMAKALSAGLQKALPRPVRARGRRRD